MYSNSDTQWFLEVNQEMEEMRCISIRCHVPDLGPATAEEKKCTTLLLGGRPPSRPGLKPNFASTAHSCTSKGQTSW